MRYPYAGPPQADDYRGEPGACTVSDHVSGYRQQIERLHKVIRESRKVVARIDAVLEHCKRMKR